MRAHRDDAAVQRGVPRDRRGRAPGGARAARAASSTPARSARSPRCATRARTSLLEDARGARRAGSPRLPDEPVAEPGQPPARAERPPSPPDRRPSTSYALQARARRCGASYTF